MPNVPTNEESPWLASLWDAYGRGGKSTTIRNQLVTHYYGLLAPLIRRLQRSLPHHVDRDLLESAAGQGLVEAVEQFDRHKSDNFRGFAEMVMRRRVTDALRQHGPRREHDARPYSPVRANVEATLSQQLGRRPSEEELDQFVRQDSTNARAESASMTQRNHRTSRNPYALNAAMEASRVLDVRDAAILHLYLVGDFSQQKIAELFGITQPRVSQILHAARAAYIPNESIDGGRRDGHHTRPTLPREDHT